MNKHLVLIRPDGTVTGISSPVTQALGLQQRKRVSHIEPVSLWLRVLFHVIRRRTTDNSALAAFTRRWPCQWQVRFLSSGMVLGPFSSREIALQAEIAKVNMILKEEHGQGQNNATQS